MAKCGNIEIAKCEREDFLRLVGAVESNKNHRLHIACFLAGTFVRLIGRLAF